MTLATPRRPARLLPLLAVAAAALATAATVAAAPATEHITLSSTTVNGVDKNMRVVASGPIRGVGTFTGSDLQDPSRDLITFHFRRGTITISGKERSTTMTPNLRSCTASGVGRGTFTVTGGTGVYAGAGGQGTYLRHTSMIGARSASGACLGQRAQPKLIRYRATLVGNITLG